MMDPVKVLHRKDLMELLTCHRFQAHITFRSVEEDQGETLFMLLVFGRLGDFVQSGFEMSTRNDWLLVSKSGK